MDYLQKILNKFRSYPRPAFLRLSLKLRSPQLTAWALKLLCGKINDSGRFTVLCLGRSVFLDDVKALAALGQNLQYVVIHIRHFKTIFGHLVKKSETEGLTESNYHSHSLSEKGRNRYYAYLKKVLPFLQKLIGFDAVLSGNVGYIVQQEIAKVCEAERVPFIVLHKEGMDAFGYVHTYDGQKFIGARMLFGNQKMRDSLLAMKMPGLTEDKARVVGMPRFDFYHSQNDHSPKKQVVFFSFFPQDRLIASISEGKNLQQAKEAYANFHKLVMEFALRHPEIKVTIKTKAAAYFVQYVKDILQASFPEGIPNLFITNSINPFELIRNSDAVVSFNSTTLIEGLLGGKIIISPDFRDLISDTSWNFFASYPDLIHYVKNESELEDRLLHPRKYSEYDPSRKQAFLKEVIFLPDGKASLRTELEILGAIKEYQTKIS